MAESHRERLGTKSMEIDRDLADFYIEAARKLGFRGARQLVEELLYAARPDVERRVKERERARAAVTKPAKR